MIDFGVLKPFVRQTARHVMCAVKPFNKHTIHPTSSFGMLQVCVYVHDESFE